MEEWILEATHYTGLAIEAMAVVVIVFGTLHTVVRVAKLGINDENKDAQRAAWMQYARWLILGLTFLLAADIVHTTVAPDWNQIGQLAAIAVIRTFLAFFLDRDVHTVSERRQKAAQKSI